MIPAYYERFNIFKPLKETKNGYENPINSKICVAIN